MCLFLVVFSLTLLYYRNTHYSVNRNTNTFRVAKKEDVIMRWREGGTE